MKRWMMLTFLLCVFALTACGARKPPEEPPERNMITITVPEEVVEATVFVDMGPDSYWCRYTDPEDVESLTALLEQIGERPEYPKENEPFAGFTDTVTLICADGSKEKYAWCSPCVMQGDGPWCELSQEEGEWLRLWLAEHGSDEISKLN